METTKLLRERAKQIQFNTEQTYQQLQDQGIQTDKLVKLSTALEESVGVFTLPEQLIQDEENTVQFNKALIKNLVSEHKGLLNEFTNMLTAANSENFYLANQSLAAFASQLKAHLDLELVELYVYLESIAEQMSIEEEMAIKDFSDEMDKIGFTVTNLINKYINQVISATNKDQFLADFNGVAGILTDRIKREESYLYPLYARHGSGK